MGLTGVCEWMLSARGELESLGGRALVTIHLDISLVIPRRQKIQES